MSKLINPLVFAIALCTAFITNAFAESGQPGPALNINLINEAGVSDRILNTAREHVEQIFGHAGIQIGWNEGRGLPLTVILVSKSKAYRLGPQYKLNMGIAISNDAKEPRRAYVFAHRVSELAWTRLRAGQHVGSFLSEDLYDMLRRKDAEGTILGHVIAHEIGHLMLPHGAHSAKGLMSPGLDNGDLRSATHGSLLFSPDQSETMRAVLRQIKL